MYEELTRDEVLALKDGDECYIRSSWGMQRCIYPNLEKDTHRNMFWSKQLTDLGYTPPPEGVPKTTEMMRDWGPIYKKKEQ